MKLWVVLPILLLTSCSPASIERIDVIEYGIYNADTQSTSAAPNTPAVVVRSVSNLRHVSQTRTIPLQMGTRFGFRYRLVGSPAGAKMALRFKVIFPAPGLRNPQVPEPVLEGEYEREKLIGVESYTDYGFDHDWELVPGIWTFQVWHRSRKLTEQKFTVVAK